MIRLLLLIPGAALLLLACGPVGYISQVSRRAATAVEEARQAGAERLAPYEFTAATVYLHEARDEAAAAQYQIAIQYGQRAEQLAERAKLLAQERANEAPKP
jgi:hypothetical protein